MSSASSSATPTTPSSSQGSSGSGSFGSSGSSSSGASRSAANGSVKIGSATPMVVDDLRNAKFTTAFRGYDSAEVRAFLQRMATRVEAELGLVDRVAFTPIASDAELVLDEAAYLAAAEAATSALDSGPVQTADEVLLAARSEYESILASARNEANAIVVKANDDAARIILRARAESRGKPSADSSAVVEAAYAQAANDPELAREQARLMITEARAVRERILTDLNKRRRVAHVQLEQLRVAREKLTETLREARRIVDDSARDLSTAEVEARLAADAAGRRISAEALPSIGELEVELWGGRHMPSTPTFASSSTPTSDADDSFENSVAASTPTPVAATSGEVPGASTVEALAPAVGVVVPTVETSEAVTLITAVETDVLVAEDSNTSVTVEVAVETASAETAGTAEATKKRPANVDDLFARLRADRERAAVEARSVLGVKESDEGVTGAVLDLRPNDGSGETGNHGSNSSKRSKGTSGSPKPGRGSNGGGGASSDSSAQSALVQAGGVAILDRTVAGTTTDEHVTAIVLDLRPSNPPIDLRTAPVGSSTSDAEHTVSEADDGIDFVVGPLHSSLIRTVKRRLHDEQSSILAMLRSYRGTLDVDRLLGSAQDHQHRLTSEIQPIFMDAFRVGAEKSGSKMSEREINELLREHIESVAASVTATIRSEVASIVAEQGGNDSRALGESLTSTYRTWTTERIGTVVTGAVVETYRLGTAA